MSQLVLPFPNLFVPEKHRLWFRMANAGQYAFKRDWFYPFKTRFLVKHAIPDGYDLQIIERLCHSCFGTGIWTSEYTGREDICWRCTKGVYDLAHIRLTRWDLCGEIFHCPDGRILSSQTGHRNVFHGLIKHAQTVPDSHAFRAFLRLLLRYEPLTLWNIQTLRLKQGGNRLSYPIRRHWTLLDRMMREDACPEVDDGIPF